MKPGIASEDLVGTFSRKGHLAVIFYHGAELEQGRVNISHGGQVMSQHRIRQPFFQSQTAAFQEVMICFQIVCHFLRIGPVSGGLKIV